MTVFLCVRFDPDFVSNASDKKRRYSYQAQPSVCRWNLACLAEALGSELDPAEAGAVLDEFMPTYEAFYLSIMRKKLGLVRIEEAEDRELVSDLLRVMHNTGKKKKRILGSLTIKPPIYPLPLTLSPLCFGIMPSRCRFHKHLPLAESCPLAWRGR